jgi:hypothetical protein
VNEEARALAVQGGITRGCQQKVGRSLFTQDQPLAGSKPTIAAEPSYSIPAHVGSKGVAPALEAEPADAWSVRGRQLLPHAHNSRTTQPAGLPHAAAAPATGPDSEQQPDQGPCEVPTHSNSTSGRAPDGADLLAALDAAAKEAVAMAWNARRCLRTGDDGLLSARVVPLHPADGLQSSIYAPCTSWHHNICQQLSTTS